MKLPGPLVQPLTGSHVSAEHEHWNLQRSPYPVGGQGLVQLNPWDPMHAKMKKMYW